MRMMANPVDMKVAVLLNANAKRVSHRVHESLRHVVPERDLFLSRSENDAGRIADEVVERGYETVFTGGGDGTFVSFVTEILRRVAPGKAPRFGLLKLGTGNALAGMVGATGGEGIIDDVLRARAGEVPNVKRIDLLEVEGKLSPFAGVGIDGAILNDYVATKKLFGNGRFKAIGAGGLGYTMAVVGKTAPRYLLAPKRTEFVVVNDGAPAVLLAKDGSVARTFQRGEELFRGPAKMCSVGTTPFYGYGFEMFPYAGKERGRMHLRIADMPAARIIANLPAIWGGTYRNPGELHDFLAERVRVTSADELPLQVGGDAEGYRREVSFQVSKTSVELVDFSSVLH